MRTPSEMTAEDQGLPQWCIEMLLEAPEEVRARVLSASAYGPTAELRQQVVLEWLVRLREIDRKRGKQRAEGR